ncbi:MAG: LytTR family DNA-binding domain-containing protein [Bacteroidota bacterium]
MKAIIIDDEDKAVKSIGFILTNHCENITVVGTANSVDEGVKLIYTHHPDIVFLDIEMPEANGFDLLKRIPDRDFEVIFITAYNQYAMKAIKVSAFDYILKPIDIDDISNAIKKVAQKKTKDADKKKNMEMLFENIRSGKPRKIAVPASDGTRYLDVDEIFRIEADRSYSTFYFVNGNRLVVSKSLKEFAAVLEGDQFYRPHRAHLINLDYLKKHVKQGGGFIIMTDGTKIPLARQKKHDFVSVMEKQPGTKS